MTERRMASARRKWMVRAVRNGKTPGLLDIAGLVGLGVGVLLSLSHFLAGVLWAADTLELFRPYIAIAVVLPLVILLIARAWFGSVAAALVLAFNIGLLITSASAASVTAAASIKQTLTIATFNCLGTNTASDTFAVWVRRAKPDVIALEEMPGDWASTLTGLKDLYPYRSSEAGAIGGDTELFSRFPITSASAFAPALDQRRVVYAAITINGIRVDVFAVHPNTLRDKEQWTERNEFLGLAAQYAASTSKGHPHMVLGDWNVAQWSPFFQSFVKSAQVRSLDAEGLAPPATRVLLSVAGINIGSPIDHIAVDTSFDNEGCEVGPDLRSDHLPLICRARLRPPAQAR